MIGIALGLAAIAPVANEGPTLPIATGPTMGRYAVCLFQPASDFSGEPAIASEREALAARIIERCAPTRRLSAAEAENILATDRSYPELSARRAAVEFIFSRWEEQLRFMIVEHERFVEASETYEACLDREDSKQC